jgi:hypothetical protein
LERAPDILESGTQSEKTNLKRVIKIFDWLKYGEKEQGAQPPIPESEHK